MDEKLKDILKEEKKRKMEKEFRERKHREDSGRKTETDRKSETDRTQKDRGNKEGKSDREQSDKEKSDKRKEREQKERKYREQKERERKEKERQQKKEENTEDTKQEDNREIPEEFIDDSIEKFMFIYQDKNGVLHSKIDNIQKEEGDVIKIFPVYIKGYNTNLTEEIVTFTNNELIPSEENNETSWLKVIHSNESNISILPFNIEQIVIYNSHFFHCIDDLYYFIEQNGPDFLDVNIKENSME